MVHISQVLENYNQQKDAINDQHDVMHSIAVEALSSLFVKSLDLLGVTSYNGKLYELSVSNLSCMASLCRRFLKYYDATMQLSKDYELIKSEIVLLQTIVQEGSIKK